MEGELRQFSPAILAQFQKALPAAMEHLSPDELEQWAERGLAIARLSSRAWEAALEYFKASPKVLQKLPFADFLCWAQIGEGLSQQSSALSSAYFRASPATLPFLSPAQIGDWARIGKMLYRETWRSSSLCSQLFESSPKLLRYLSLEEAERFVCFLQSINEKSYDFAVECLALTDEVFPAMEKGDRKPFLELALLLTETNPRDAKAYFASGAKILSRIGSGQRGRFLSLAQAIASLDGSHTPSFLFEGSQALGKVDEGFHGRLLDLFEQLMPLSMVAAIEFLKSSPTLMARIGISGTESWFEEGKRTLRRREEAGKAFFRLESSKGEEVLERLSSRVELDQVREVLRMYSRALTGRNAHILSTENLKQKGIGWTSVERPSTEGSSVYLPPLIDRYHTKEQNFTWYKVMATHQAGHLEFGSFDFCFQKGATLFPNLRFELAGQGGDSITDVERFFDLFHDRRLAADIFTAVEDARVDHLLKGEYAGIRAAYERIQREALERRPPLPTLPLREAFVEFLVQLSLNDIDQISFPALLEEELRYVAGIMSMVKSPQATVEDSAEATIRLYAVLSHIDNQIHDGDWQTVRLGPPSPDELRLSLEGDGRGDMPQGEELPYSSPEPVEFRGDFKPELVQLLMKLREDYSQKGGPASPLSPEALKELIEKSAEIEITDLGVGDLSAMGLFLSNLLDEAQKPLPATADQERKRDTSGKSKLYETPLEEEERSFLYDEWDFRANDYKPRWCRVREKALAEGTPDFFENTLKEHSRLAARIKRQFETLIPELFKKIKRLHDGEDFDIDAVIESMVEKKAGVTPSEKIYWRRNKIERDVSVVFLLDMSASTSEAIEEVRRSPEPWELYGDLRGYISWLRTQHDEVSKAKQIIDVEKESLVLLIGALETIGDRYGIYGFSGYGRDNVEFYVIKDVAEDFSERVKRRIDKVTPLHATRMGPAIRHATSKLDAQDSKTKILILISDGRPQDHGYGRDSMEKDYAINDTKMALLEAKRKDIIPFCLTVDKAGHDYLKKMCHDIGYEVVWNIQSLPQRLPSLYRRLTA